MLFKDGVLQIDCDFMLSNRARLHHGCLNAAIVVELIPAEVRPAEPPHHLQTAAAVIRRKLALHEQL